MNPYALEMAQQKQASYRLEVDQDSLAVECSQEQRRGKKHPVIRNRKPWFSALFSRRSNQSQPVLK